MSKHNFQPFTPKEYEKAYYFVYRVIESCDDADQLNVCRDLVKLFGKKKFKRDIPSDKQMKDMVSELECLLTKKKNSVRFRKYYERKTGERAD